MDARDRNRKNLATYGRTAEKYSGDAGSLDDPQLRTHCRDVFKRAIPGKRVLEIGCGPGSDAAAFQDAGLDVLASDGTPEFLEIVRQRYPSIRTETLDLANPPWALGPFDGIYGYACFQHLPRELAPAALSGLSAMLCQGGVLYLVLIRSDKVRSYVLDEWVGETEVPLLFTCYDPPEFASLMKEAGFEGVAWNALESEVYDHLPRLVSRGVRLYEIWGHRADLS